MKSAGKARSNGLYRHIRTSKEIIRNLLNDSNNKMMNIGPDAGACLHPSIHRHQLMAQELVTFIQNLPQE